MNKEAVVKVVKKVHNIYSHTDDPLQWDAFEVARECIVLAILRHEKKDNTKRG